VPTSTLTPELPERIESELSDGIPIVVVAQNLGVGRSTLHEWIDSVRVRRPRAKLELVQGALKRLERLAYPRFGIQLF
jgi:hypothetical protein